MSQSSRITRVASAIGVGGIAVLALFVPTGAYGEPPNAPPGVDLGAAMNGNVHVPPVDIGAAKNDIHSELIDVRGLLRDIERTLPAYVAPLPYSPPTQVLADDNSVELLQLAIGAAVGTAVGAAGLGAFMARNRRRAAQPQA